MRPSIADLIHRMSAKEQVTDSDQSVRWHAHREAERLSDPDLLADLQSFVASSKSKDERKAAYFLLGALGSNASNPHCARVLIERLHAERDKYVLAVVLEALAKIEKPDGLPLDAIFSCLSDDRWSVRHAAICALRKTNSAEVEERLLQHLSSTTEPYDMIYCHVTLGCVGGAKSLPALQAGLASRKRDVKASAEAAVRAINSRLASLGSPPR
jgi:HEAT repeat protein